MVFERELKSDRSGFCLALVAKEKARQKPTKAHGTGPATKTKTEALKMRNARKTRYFAEVYAWNLISIVFRLQL